tara:strand:- start:262 stop:525 length:264 start_codon:yes stop_codon:yes gene_type:complete
MSKQLSKEQLEVLQGLQKSFNEAKFEIADLEMKKLEVIEKVSDIKKEFSVQEKNLMEEFGKDVIINLQTGEVQDPEPKEEEPLEVIK